MSTKNLPSQDPSDSSREPSDDLDELRAVLTGLESEVERLEDTGNGEQVQEWLNDLEDPTNATRLAEHRTRPRDRSESLFEELGDGLGPSKRAHIAGAAIDLNPKPSSVRSLVKAKETNDPMAAQPPKKSKLPRKSTTKAKREARRLARLEKKAKAIAQRTKGS